MLNGRCACNAVAYEVADEFVTAYNCHCSNCRAQTGAAFLPVGQIGRDKLRVTKGAESLLLEGDPDSAHEVRCAKCFSLLYWTYPDGNLGVPYGTLVDEPTLKPMHHQFVGSKAPWYEILDDLPQHDEYPWSVLESDQMLPEGVHHWTATHPEWEGPVSAYAIDDGERLVLIDPIAVPDDVRALFASREVVTVLTSTWHERDAAALGFPVWAPAPDRPEDQLVPATRYAIGDSLFGLEAYPGREGELDLVLWCERLRAVIAGDTLIDLGNGLEIAPSWLPEGVTVEQVAAGLRPLLEKPVEHVLPTHGDPAGRAALERALA